MIGRANLCEPEFCNKAQNGQEADIRPCIGCLRCLNGTMFGKRVACTVNPSLEPENEDTILPADEKKKVLVIGGGPAGMEAAYVAAKRGHHVVLADRQDALGGTVRIAAVPIFQTGSDSFDQISSTQTGRNTGNNSPEYRSHCLK